jgi:hypothetical protein
VGRYEVQRPVKAPSWNCISPPPQRKIGPMQEQESSIQVFTLTSARAGPVLRTQL